MINLWSARRCLLCVPVAARPDLSLEERWNCSMQLFHFWHQTQGDAFTHATVRALGLIARVAEVLEEVRLSEGTETVECPDCRELSGRALAGILLDLHEDLRTCVTWPDRSGMHRALRARNDAIEGDAEAVDGFSDGWLRLPRPAAWREAVEMALLGEWVESLGDGTADEPALVALLRRRIQSEHRRLQPLWERTVLGRRTVLLGTPVGDGLALGDLLVVPGGTEEAALAPEFLDPRVVAVLRQLRAPEEVVARSWALTGDAWARAAVEAGLPAEYGERVRRKLKRLGARHAVRAVEAAGWRAGRACP
jgi:hypothetical protein